MRPGDGRNVLLSDMAFSSASGAVGVVVPDTAADIDRTGTAGRCIARPRAPAIADAETAEGRRYVNSASADLRSEASSDCPWRVGISSGVGTTGVATCIKVAAVGVRVAFRLSFGSLARALIAI